MDCIRVNMRYCYGIAEFDHSFAFRDGIKAYVIYAPNGIMKTSFTNALYDIQKGKRPSDRAHPDRETICDIQCDGEPLSGERILAIRSYIEMYEAENTSALMANADLKQEYESIHADVSTRMKALLTEVKKMAGKRDIESLLAHDFGKSIHDLCDIILSIFDDYGDQDLDMFCSIKYNALFTKESERILSIPEVVSKISEYLEEYNNLVSQSKIFGSTFHHNNADKTADFLEKRGFFDKLGVVISGTGEQLNKESFPKAIQAEKQRILKESLQTTFSELDAVLGDKEASTELRQFLHEHRELIPELANVAELKRKLWASYMFYHKELLFEFVQCYKRSFARIKEIETRAQAEATSWDSVIEKYNDRFSNMPFQVKAVRREDAILRGTLPAFEFKFRDSIEEDQPVPVTKRQLFDWISDGEKKALYLLDVIYEIEARVELQQPTFLVIDDIVDSFDYRNKYAMIEYLIDIIHKPEFHAVIFTHNFDFYRTLMSRAGWDTAKACFARVAEHRIVLDRGEYTKNVLFHWKEELFTDRYIYLAAITFARNLIEYLESKATCNYSLLTNLLHVKEGDSNRNTPSTGEILPCHLTGIYQRVFGKEGIQPDETIVPSDKAVIRTLFEAANTIASDATMSLYKLEHKVVLAVAIRLTVEYFMIYELNAVNEQIITEHNQTRELRDAYASMPNCDPSKLKTIERVLIITSENIHLNSFMYEPIIDLGMEELISLYNEVSKEFGASVTI